MRVFSGLILVLAPSLKNTREYVAHGSLSRKRFLRLCVTGFAIKRDKGIWWMPWHREAMKDVARCEKLRGGASTL